MIFDLWEDIGIKTNKENNQNTYVINPVKQDNIQIDVYKTIQNSYEVKEVIDNLQGNKIYKKNSTRKLWELFNKIRKTI